MKHARPVRLTAGPFEAFAYHDYPLNVHKSPLYIGVKAGPLCFETMLPADSRLRPFSGGETE
jgi:hypothetical protein